MGDNVSKYVRGVKDARPCERCAQERLSIFESEAE